MDQLPKVNHRSQVRTWRRFSVTFTNKNSKVLGSAQGTDIISLLDSGFYFKLTEFWSRSQTRADILGQLRNVEIVFRYEEDFCNHWKWFQDFSLSRVYTISSRLSASVRCGLEDLPIICLLMLFKTMIYLHLFQRMKPLHSLLQIILFLRNLVHDFIRQVLGDLKTSS